MPARVFIPIFTTGMGQCCRESIDAMREFEDTFADGQTWTCRCGIGLRVRAGAWEATWAGDGKDRAALPPSDHGKP